MLNYNNDTLHKAVCVCVRVCVHLWLVIMSCVWTVIAGSLFQTCQRTGSVRCQRRCVSLSRWRRWACTTTVCDPSHPACASCKPSPTSTSGKTPPHLQIQAPVPHTHSHHLQCAVYLNFRHLNTTKTFRGQLVFNKRKDAFSKDALNWHIIKLFHLR